MVKAEPGHSTIVGALANRAARSINPGPARASARTEEPEGRLGLEFAHERGMPLRLFAS